MRKKLHDLILTVLFLTVMSVPLLFARWETGGVSAGENRNLAAFPSVMTEGRFNLSFTTEFETWFMDHMGFRQKLIGANKALMQKVFNRSLSNSDVKTGKTGDVIYATNYIIKDFAHANLRSEEDVQKIGDSYQTVNDWLETKGIPFCYVQCVDKHTIYPERFLDSVLRIGTVSKTDQVIEQLKQETTVKYIYFKDVLMENRTEYPVFSHWGDSTHWTDRGAYISYCHMQEQLSTYLETPLKILKEEEYEITYAEYTGPEGQTEQIEVFTIRDPKARKADSAQMGKWGEDYRHSIWQNPEAGNDIRLLLVCDSYINSFLIDDIAESFGEVWLVWGEYIHKTPEIVEACDPDLVIFENAERVDRSSSVRKLAEILQAENP